MLTKCQIHDLLPVDLSSSVIGPGILNHATTIRQKTDLMVDRTHSRFTSDLPLATRILTSSSEPSNRPINAEETRDKHGNGNRLSHRKFTSHDISMTGVSSVVCLGRIILRHWRFFLYTRTCYLRSLRWNEQYGRMLFKIRVCAQIDRVSFFRYSSSFFVIGY